MSSISVSTEIVLSGQQDATGRDVSTFGRRDRRHNCLRSSRHATHHGDTMSKLVFLPSEDEILIQEVQNNPILYNMATADYKNIIIKDNIWKDIASKIGKSGK